MKKERGVLFKKKHFFNVGKSQGSERKEEQF